MRVGTSGRGSRNGSRKARVSLRKFRRKATKAKSYATWRKGFRELDLPKSATRVAGESRAWISRQIPARAERDFRVRLQQIAREQRDEAVEKLRRKYAPKFEQLEERKRRAEQAVERETEQAKGQKMQTAISFGATLLVRFSVESERACRHLAERRLPCAVSDDR